MASAFASPLREVVFVGRLPRGTTELDLREAFAHVGVDVGKIELVRDHVTGLPRGFAFIVLHAGVGAEAIARAVGRLRTATVDGNLLTIRCVPERSDAAPTGRAGTQLPSR